MKILLDHQVNAQAQDQVSELIARCEIDFRFPVLCRLLNERCLQDGSTPLHFACSNGHAKVAELLLRYGVDTTVKDEVSVPFPQ